MSRASRGFRIFGKTLKILFFMLIFSVIFFLFWRIFSSDNPKSMEQLSINDKLAAAYEQDGNDLDMFNQNLDMITRADHNYGYFAVTDSVFIPAANQIQITFRYNNSTITHLVEDKGLDETPSRDDDLFDVTLLLATDLTPENTEDNLGNDPASVKMTRVHASSVTADKKNVYNYRRLVFDLDEVGVSLEELLEDGELLAVYTDVYYVGDVNYDEPTYGTLCIYDHLAKTYDVELSGADKRALRKYGKD
ncbi:MAG: hypothetical protein IJD64_04395 [Clostridia bacterium]|nr:hypothetical protein [Clostridia bacterium]